MIAVWIGRVAHDDVHRVHAPLREVGVQIHGHGQRHVADHFAHALEQHALRITQAVHAHGAVQAEVETVEGELRAQALEQLVHQRVEALTAERTAGDGPGAAERYQVHVARVATRAHEAAELGVGQEALGLLRTPLAGASELLAAQMMHAVEVVERREDGRERVRLLGEARVGEAQAAWVGVGHGRTLPAAGAGNNRSTRTDVVGPGATCR